MFEELKYWAILIVVVQTGLRTVDTERNLHNFPVKLNSKTFSSFLDAHSIQFSIWYYCAIFLLLNCVLILLEITILLFEIVSGNIATPDLRFSPSRMLSFWFHGPRIISAASNVVFWKFFLAKTCCVVCHAYYCFCYGGTNMARKNVWKTTFR